MYRGVVCTIPGAEGSGSDSARASTSSWSPAPVQRRVTASSGSAIASACSSPSRRRIRTASSALASTSSGREAIWCMRARWSSTLATSSGSSPASVNAAVSTSSIAERPVPASSTSASRTRTRCAGSASATSKSSRARYARSAWLPGAAASTAEASQPTRSACRSTGLRSAASTSSSAASSRAPRRRAASAPAASRSASSRSGPDPARASCRSRSASLGAVPARRWCSAARSLAGTDSAATRPSAAGVNRTASSSTATSPARAACRRCVSASAMPARSSCRTVGPQQQRGQHQGAAYAVGLGQQPHPQHPLDARGQRARPPLHRRGLADRAGQGERERGHPAGLDDHPLRHRRRQPVRGEQGRQVGRGQRPHLDVLDPGEAGQVRRLVAEGGHEADPVDHPSAGVHDRLDGLPVQPLRVVDQHQDRAGRGQALEQVQPGPAGQVGGGGVVGGADQAVAKAGERGRQLGDQLGGRLVPEVLQRRPGEPLLADRAADPQHGGAGVGGAGLQLVEQGALADAGGSVEGDRATLGQGAAYSLEEGAATDQRGHLGEATGGRRAPAPRLGGSGQQRADDRR